MPINQKQLILHWKKWRKAVVPANDWQMAKGRWVAENPQRTRRDSEWHDHTWYYAEALAAKEARAVVADDLRKGAYCTMLGSYKSLTQFNNQDLDRVLAIFDVLANPLPNQDRECRLYVAWDHAIRTGVPKSQLPEEPGRRRRCIKYLNTVPTHTLAAIAADKAGPYQERGSRMAHWESLPIVELQELVMTCKNRSSCARVAPPIVQIQTNAMKAPDLVEHGCEAEIPF